MLAPVHTIVGWRNPELNATQRNTISIPYTSRDFPSGILPDQENLQTTWSELIWAALTVGRPSTAYVFAHGEASFFEAMFRLSLVQMALEQDPLTGTLQRTDAFRSLDLTEKGAVSYFLGMAVCKLFASRLLNIAWLLHLDVFRDQLNPAILRGRSRPDLVGHDDNDEWHAFECKGRSSVPSEAVRRKAKEQAQRLVRVNSTKCVLHVAAISYFQRDALRFHWRDPEPKGAEALEPINVRLPENALRHYYAPALALAMVGEEIKLTDAQTDADVKVEIHDAIRALIQAGMWSDIRMRSRELRPDLEEAGFRPDGLKIVAGESWGWKREMTTPDV